MPSIANVCAGSIRMYLVHSPISKFRNGLWMSGLKGLGFVSETVTDLIAPFTSYHSLAAGTGSQCTGSIGPWGDSVEVDWISRLLQNLKLKTICVIQSSFSNVASMTFVSAVVTTRESIS